MILEDEAKDLYLRDDRYTDLGEAYLILIKAVRRGVREYEKNNDGDEVYKILDTALEEIDFIEGRR